MFVPAHKLENLLRRRPLETFKDRSIRSVQVKPIEPKGRLARRLVLLLAEVAAPRALFQAALDLSGRLPAAEVCVKSAGWGPK